MWIRSQESIRSIPIVFVDGDAKRVERIRADLSDALYTSRAKLVSALRRAKPLANPVVGYGNRTTAQKLGIRGGAHIAVIDAPAGYAKLVGPLPAGASLKEDPEEALAVTLWFVRDPEVYLADLPRMRKLAAARSRLCVIYPKQGPGQRNHSILHPRIRAGDGASALQNLLREQDVERNAIRSEEIVVVRFVFVTKHGPPVFKSQV
jgi:hypothetical protein